MFTLLKSLHSRQVYLSEPVSFVAALVIAGPWMLQVLLDYTRRLIESLPQMVG